MKNFLFIILVFFTISLNAQNALDFNGNNWVVTDPIGSLGDFTIEMDIRIDGSGTGTNYQRILSTINNGLSIAVDPFSGNNIRIFSANLNLGWINSPVNLTTNTWYHMAWVREATTITLYINGASAWTYPCSASNLASSNWFLAANENNLSENANCTIDNFRLWNDARTSTEISGNYQSCVSTSDPNLITLYDFEEGTGTTTSDLATTDGSQNGTLIGSPQWSLEGFSCKTTQAMLAGDIAIIGINSDNFSASVRDDFTFITLKEIPAGEVIYFTADGWGGTDWSGSNGGGHYSWTAPAGGLGCGTVVHVYMTSTLNVLASSIGFISGPYSGLPASNYLLFADGDQILMYQASSPGDMNPTFITAITFSSDNTNYNATTTWNNISTNAAAYSVLPLGLTNGVNCVSLYPNPSTTNSGLDNSKYTGTLTGNASTLRALINDYINWSGNDATPYDLSPAQFSASVVCPVITPDLVISEIMYNPPEAGTDTLEFIEIYNNDANPVDLTNYTLAGVTYTFPSVILNPGEFYVVAVNSGAFNNVFGSMPDGVFTGGLSNGGEFVTIKNASGNLVDSVRYYTSAPWPTDPNAQGPSLVLCDVNADNNDGNNWNASVIGTGVIINGKEVKASPGAANFCCSMDVTPPVITCAGTDTLYAGTGACGAVSKFVNEYYIPLSQFTAFSGTGGPGCNPTLDIYSCGGDMTFTWNSIETGMPSSVEIEFFQTWYDEGGVSPTMFNGSANNDYVSADYNCSNNVISYTLNTSGYVVGGLNEFTISPATNCIVLDENPDVSWAPQSYAKVSVYYGSTLTAPTVTDNCTVDAVYNDAPLNLPVGTTTVTWTAEDANGNSNTCMQQVVVIDTVAPMINCPADVTLAADMGTCSFDVSSSFENVYYISLSDISSDGIDGPDCNGTGNDAYSCDSVDLSIVWTSIETAMPSSVEVEFYQSYYDVGGNSYTQFNGVPNNDYVSADYSCSNQVINYTLNPTGYIVGGLNAITIIPPTNCIVLDENPNPSWAPQSYAKVTVSYGIGSATASDNCTLDTMYNDAPANLPVGTTTVTWTAVDVNGNSSTCSQQVTIEDQEAPMAVCQNINAYLDGSGMVIIPDNAIDGGSSDNCAGALTYNAQLVTFTCNELGANTDTLTVMDAAGNTSTCVATVTVVDTLAPVVTCPGNQNETPGASCQFTLPDYTGLATVSDNCSASPTITQSPLPGTVVSSTTTITISATDGSTNISTCTFDVVFPAIDNTIDNSLMPTLTANQTGATYRWLDCDNGNAVIPSETGQSFTATMNGNYAVEITLGNCVDTSACENITGVGVREMSTNVVSIYPNPTSGMFTVDLGGNTIVNYTLVTLEGRIVEQGKTAENKIILDLSGESKGVYFLQLKDDTSSQVFKVLKQ
ncbi:MAG: lamin tail domain-containing protein [Flavobacteriales bacterium]|nr:lamin tail domain-containing protein [Flavobacteriales bacterium]